MCAYEVEREREDKMRDCMKRREVCVQVRETDCTCRLLTNLLLVCCLFRSNQLCTHAH